MEIKWWMAALAGIVLAMLPSLFLWGKIRPRNQDPELLSIARLSRLLSRGRGMLSYRQTRQLEKADPWVVYRVLLKDYDNWSAERQCAVTCILAQNGYVERAIKLLKSANPIERIQGGELLGFLQSPTAVTPLLEAMSDPDEEVRLVVSSALKRIRDQSVVPKLIQALEPPSNVTPARVAEIILARGPSAVELILKSLNEVSESTRGFLISVLGEIGSPEVASDLMKALQDQSPGIRSCAAEALGQLGQAEAGPALIPLLKDEAAEVRARAAQALGNLGWYEALPALHEARKDEEWKVRASANQAINDLKQRKTK